MFIFHLFQSCSTFGIQCFGILINKGQNSYLIFRFQEKIIYFFIFSGWVSTTFACESSWIICEVVSVQLTWTRKRLIVRQCFYLILNIFHITINCMSVKMIIFWITWVHFSWFYFWSAIFWNHIHLFNVYWYFAFSFEVMFLLIFPSLPVAGWVSIEV